MKTFQELYDKHGNYITDSRYTEIKKLHDMLIESKVPLYALQIDKILPTKNKEE